MAVYNIPVSSTEIKVRLQELLDSIGVNTEVPGLPFTAQAKLTYLIENLIQQDSQGNNIQLAATMERLRLISEPPTTVNQETITVGTTVSKIINAETTAIRKGFSIYNPSSTATISIGYVAATTSSNRKLVLQPGFYYEDPDKWQGEVYALSSSGNVSLLVVRLY